MNESAYKQPTINELNAHPDHPVWKDQRGGCVPKDNEATLEDLEPWAFLEFQLNRWNDSKVLHEIDKLPCYEKGQDPFRLLEIWQRIYSVKCPHISQYYYVKQVEAIVLNRPGESEFDGQKYPGEGFELLLHISVSNALYQMAGGLFAANFVEFATACAADALDISIGCLGLDSLLEPNEVLDHLKTK
jgi:hypothetical protein